MDNKITFEGEILTVIFYNIIPIYDFPTDDDILEEKWNRFNKIYTEYKNDLQKNNINFFS